MEGSSVVSERGASGYRVDMGTVLVVLGADSAEVKMVEVRAYDIILGVRYSWAAVEQI